ncbi:Putative cell wall binding repeat 2 [Sporomusa ovata DSM 2662]|uniref:Uncharacterized protein n=1 Tax=Sporomusa ovata TaxID=2378 RepID=A0A0U1L382_9FIRM|nr:cell wall-binding repeat 2 family protein [Sporomusa ovata]EQB25226.1 hypothetical protein SOV_5c03940 [Sporomusa ovata DSM 2662]CQR73789.1 FIG00516426: hypothetical protein [Sporomusa ovata]
MDIKRRLGHVRDLFWLSSVLTLALLCFFSLYRPNFYSVSPAPRPIHTEIGLTTTRLTGNTPFETAVSISQTVYPATFHDNKPGAIILVPVEDWRAGIVATEISHFPINAPILYTNRSNIPEITLDEIKRLDPEGVFQDGNIKILLIGEVEDVVKNQLHQENLKFRALSAPSPEELAALLDDYKAMYHADHSDEVIVVPRDNPEFALLATSWVAHMGHTILFASSNGLAEATHKALSNRWDAHIYVLATEKEIPSPVMAELTKYGHAQRMPGKDIWEMSAGFAGYKDVGPGVAFWLLQIPRDFGWGIAEAGHNFTFVNPKYPEYAIPASILSHMGKHGPFLLVDEKEIPAPVVRYLETVQPSYLSPQNQLFNHGWIIGNSAMVSPEIQYTADKLLQGKRQ